jgi:hypothetical protein
VRPWFNPSPNLSPRSTVDRALGALVGMGLAVVGAAAPCHLPALLASRGSAHYHPGVASPERLRIPLQHRAHGLVVATDPVWCIRRDPVPPPPSEPVPARGFRPTVLSALPLEVSPPVA